MILKIQDDIPLLSSLVFDNKSFTDFRCSIYNDKDLLCDLIKSLNDLPYKTFYFDAFHEVINFRMFEKNGLLECIKTNFKKELIFVDNNIANGYVPANIKYISNPYFLGINVDGERKVRKRKLGKHFLCLNYHERPHREEMYRFFYDNDLFKKSYFSFKPWDNTHPYNMKLDSEDITEFETFQSTQKPLFERYEYKTLDEHEKSFCSIVTETFFDKSSIQDYNNVTFITEKVEKCISAGQPFIVVGTPGYLKKLKELGFKTFDKWWDESYDEESDDIKRLNKIKNVIIELSKKSLSDLETIYTEMIKVLKTNQRLNRKWNEINKTKCSQHFSDSTCNVKQIEYEYRNK